MPKIIPDKVLIKIKQDYQSGQMSLLKIAKKYNISFNSVAKYAKQYQWDTIMTKDLNATLISHKTNKINNVVQTSLENLEKVNNNIEKTNRGLKFLEDLKSKIEQNLLLAEQMTQELLEKPTVSKTVIIDSSVKGIKKITETRSLDGHEKASLAKIVFDKYKTLYYQQEPQAPAVVINNNNQQMQVSEALKQDLQDLNERLISANIDNLTDEN